MNTLTRPQKKIIGVIESVTVGENGLDPSTTMEDLRRIAMVVKSLSKDVTDEDVEVGIAKFVSYHPDHKF